LTRTLPVVVWPAPCFQKRVDSSDGEEEEEDEEDDDEEEGRFCLDT
jgi:hypothetical protein